MTEPTTSPVGSTGATATSKPPSNERRNIAITIAIVIAIVLVSIIANRMLKHPQPTVTTAGMSLDNCKKQTVKKVTGDPVVIKAEDNTTYDFSGAKITQSGKNDYPVKFNNVKNNVCAFGTTDHNIVEGDYPASMTWYDTKQYYNGAGIYADVGHISFHKFRMNNIANDAFRIQRTSQDATGSITINKAYLTNIRDDCVSDIQHLDLEVKNSYMECYTAISWRTDNAKFEGTQHKVDLRDSLIWLKPQTASSGNCFTPGKPDSGSSDGKNAAGAVWKMDKYKGTPSKVTVTNVIYRMDNPKGRDCESKWADATYNNVTVVYTGEGDKPADVPSSVKVTKDINVWNNAVKQYKKDNGIK